MCAIKHYNDEMKAMCQGIVFRLDFYSTDIAIEKLTEICVQNRLSLLQRKLREDEMQTIDIDGCAMSTGRSLNELMMQQCTIIDKETDSHNHYRIYLCRNFMAITAKSIANRAELLQSVEMEFSAIVSIAGISPLFMNCISQHTGQGLSGDKVWQKFDKTAFPVMGEPFNGRYEDSSVVDSINRLLIREIGPIDESCQSYDVIVTAIAILEIEYTLKEGVVKELTNAVLDETTKCFL